MEEMFKFWLIAYLGMILHILKKLRAAMRKPGFTLGGFTKEQAVTTLSSIIAIPLTIYLIRDNIFLQELWPLTSFTAAAIGYIGQSVILSAFDEKFKKGEPPQAT